MTDFNGDSGKPSHKDWRKLAKKLRRKRIRQNKAVHRENDRQVEESSAAFLNSLVRDKLLEEFELENEEREKELRHRKWLVREVEAQQRWNALQGVKRKQEEERKASQDKIKAEWEAARRKRDEKERLEEAKQEEVKAKIQSFIDDGGVTPAELQYLSETNPGKEPCPFFSKVAACRFGPACSRNHSVPGISRIIVIPNFYSHFTLYQNRSNEYDTDVNLEFEETDTYLDFREFFEDVVAELRRWGQLCVVQVSRNSEPHLRGNLYAEYNSERSALTAARGLNARWYGGRQLSVNFAIVPDWGAAICGDFKRGRCPKGPECNFLHVFRNPRGDLQPVPRRREMPHREQSVRSWRWSESPDRERVRDRSRSSRRERSRNRSERSSRDRSRRSRSKEKRRSEELRVSRSKRERQDSNRSRSTERTRRRTRKKSSESFSERVTEEEQKKQKEKNVVDHNSRSRS